MILDSNPKPLELDPRPQNPNHNSPNLDLPQISQPQDLTLSYLCENANKSKGMDVIASSSSPPIERDFLQLKRENLDGTEPDGREKKVKIESLNLSLSLSTSNPLPAASKASNSDDFALSYSQSVPFSHNPSCSLIHCTTENFSMSKENDQMWYAGEGTNGSVHSRFRPVVDGSTITFANPNNDNGHGGFYRTNSADNILSFPSKLPAKMGKMGPSSMLTRPDRLLKEIVLESVSIMAQILQEIPRESLEALKDCLRNVMEADEKKDEFLGLQRRLERRSDLTTESLSRANKVQLEILVSIKTGIVGFLSGKNRVPSSELVEIFTTTRCRNLACKSLLPVDDCDCKICSTEKGFCSACMCPICLKFDCALNTCSWVGCDVCSHWCHALCGLEKNVIRPGLNRKLGNGVTEMQFMCPGCNHASEMFGFVKEVFNSCAKDWAFDSFMKELDCVRMIFHLSEDFEGKELEKKAAEMLNKLSKKQISPINACNTMLQFFKYGVSELSVTGSSSTNILSAQPSLPVEPPPLPPPPPAAMPPKPTSILESQIEVLKPIKKNPEPEPTTLAIDGFRSIETLVRFKEAEAELFQRLADDARKEVEGYRRIAKANAEKVEEEYAAGLAKLCFQEAEEGRRKKFEEVKSLENSHCDYQNVKGRMQAEIASLVQRIEGSKKQWV